MKRETGYNQYYSIYRIHNTWTRPLIEYKIEKYNTEYVDEARM
jgi:hypothetical protein